MARLLCIGDMHLGRRPSRLPADLREHGIDLRELTPVAAWRQAVLEACRREVDAVLLAGDLVQAENYRFESYGPLADGIQTLEQAGIDCIAVTGNHDASVLPRLADLLPGLTLLGAGARWERHTVQRDDEAVAHVLGWSFPASHHTESPLGSGGPTRPSDGLPTFGLLHADLGALKSAYAPVTHAALERLALTGWFLGHIHQPASFQPGKAPMGYLGSLVGLHPGEPGEHGPLLVEAHGEELTCERLPLAPVRFEELEIDIGTLETADDVLGAITRSIQELHDRIAPRARSTHAVGCRVRWVGLGDHHAALRRMDNGEIEALRVKRDDVVYFVHEVADRAKAPWDLQRMAETKDPPGLVASVLRTLEEDSPQRDSLLREVSRELQRVASSPAYSTLEPLSLNDDEVRDFLEAAGNVALEELMSQQDEHDGGDS